MHETSMSSSGERRRARRHLVEIEVTLESDHNFYMGFAENMSEGGLFVATHSLEPIGTTFDLRFTIPGWERPIEAKGEVRWVRPYREDCDMPPGMGIRIAPLEPAQSEAVERFLQERPPIFYDES